MTKQKLLENAQNATNVKVKGKYHYTILLNLLVTKTQLKFYKDRKRMTEKYSSGEK